MSKKSKFTISADIDSVRFSKQLKNALKTSTGNFHSVICEAISAEVSLTLVDLKKSGEILDFKIKPYLYPPKGINSLKDAVNSKKGYAIPYFKIQIITVKSVMLTETWVKAPKVLKWKPFSYGWGVQKYFKFKVIKQKTQNRFEIEFLTLVIPSSLLKKVFQSTSAKCKCEKNALRAVIDGAWDWHIHFICSGCGKKYLCSCFKKAFMKQTELDLKWKAEQPPEHVRIYEREGWPTIMNEGWMDNASYRPKICHLCTGTPSNLSYTSSMYGSEIKVKYGPYIMRNAVEKGINERDAENEIREVLNVPKIGEGWINETELFKIVSYLFEPKHKVLREASPVWLGRLRLDIFIPKLNLAIEYHGQQHYRPVEYFGGEVSFKKVVERDKLKRELCRKNGVMMIHFKYSEVINEESVKKKIFSKLKKRSREL